MTDFIMKMVEKAGTNVQNRKEEKKFKREHSATAPQNITLEKRKRTTTTTIEKKNNKKLCTEFPGENCLTRREN